MIELYDTPKNNYNVDPIMKKHNIYKYSMEECSSC
jgi:hypothetical protein